MLSFALKLTAFQLFFVVLISCEEDIGTIGDEGDDASEIIDEADDTDDTEEPDTSVDEETSDTDIAFIFEAWSDNWFAAYLGETLIVEDSVAITTERSFNSETATFSGRYPLQINVILKDFIENDTGLEYIGAANQQMGDGGFIAQISTYDSAEVVAVSNQEWKCLVIHKAPLDKSCEDESEPLAGVAPCDFVSDDEPLGWKSDTFDDTSWADATEHSAASVAPKGGYDSITWANEAQFIWGDDLETDNTVLCRVTIQSPE